MALETFVIEQHPEHNITSRAGKRERPRQPRPGVRQQGVRRVKSLRSALRSSNRKLVTYVGVYSFYLPRMQASMEGRRICSDAAVGTKLRLAGLRSLLIQAWHH